MMDQRRAVKRRSIVDLGDRKQKGQHFCWPALKEQVRRLLRCLLDHTTKRDQ